MGKFSRTLIITIIVILLMEAATSGLHQNRLLVASEVARPHENLRDVSNLMISKTTNGTCHLNAQQQQQQQSKEKPASRGQLKSPNESHSRQVIELKAGQNYLSSRQSELAEEFFSYQTDDKLERPPIDLASYSYMALMMKLVGASYSDYFIHHYDNFKELKASNPPETNQETCLRQLMELGLRADASNKLAQQSSDIEFHRLMDTFGRAPSGLLVGDTFWVGSYDGCKRLTVNLRGLDGKISRTPNRYCVATLRLDEWPYTNELDQIIGIKMALCLPKTCDTQHYKNKYQLIQRLIEFNTPNLDKYSARIKSIHCLPDESSLIRTWWKSRPTLIVVSLISLWISVLVYATYQDEKNRQEEPIQLNKVELNQQEHQQQAKKLINSDENEQRWLNIYRSLSITSNLRGLFKLDKTGSKYEESKQLEEKEKKIVNLDLIEGIKVLAACFIITGHVVMVASMIVKNGQELADTSSISFRLSNLMPAFAVNAFFVITGILTSYLIFKQNQSHSFITSPIKWIAFILYRYLRIMPMYALVTLFCKHISRYIGEGPLWDYGTSSLASRRTCEQEPWVWTLLFGANFKSPMRHCIPSAWYLANDFQFFIVTPIFLAALHLWPALGKRSLLAVTVVGYVAGFWNILASSNAHDVRPVVQFMPHGFMTYVTFLHPSYTQPLYRIPAYLIGLLFGYSLYQYELKRQACAPPVKKSRAEAEENGATVAGGQQEPPSPPSSSSSSSSSGEQQQQKQKHLDHGDWPRWMLSNGTRLSVALLVLLFIGSPYIAPNFNLSRSDGKLLAAFIMPTYHVISAWAVGVYILLAVTGNGNKLINGLLACKFWKPMARLSLCVVLLNVEVISYIVQTHKTFQLLNNQYHTCLNIISILCTYLVATVAHILFEAPLRAALSYLIAFVMQRAVTVTKQRNKSD